MDNLNSLLRKRVSDLVLTRLDTQLDEICHQLKRSEEINGNGIQISISSDQIQEIASELKKQIKSEIRIEKRQKVTEEEEQMDIEDDGQPSTDLNAQLNRKVVENSLILKCILSKLRTDDVLNCRLVCSSWDETATLVLTKRNNTMIFKNEWNLQESKWDVYRFENSSWRTLDMLTMLLRSSKRFPSHKFEFDGGSFKSQDIQRFFNLPFCNSITSLGISPNFVSDPENRETEAEGSQVNLRDVGKLLVEKVPNLETLNICLPCDSAWSGYETSFFPPNEPGSIKNLKCLLPALKNLSIIHNRKHEFESGITSVTKELLMASPNLKWFNLFCLVDGLELLLSMKKEHLVKSIRFAPSDRNLGLWDKFLSLNLKVNRINIDTTSIHDKPELWSKTEQILSKLLEQNKDNLIKFCVYGSLGFLPGLKLPIFKNLKYLDLNRNIQSGFSQPQWYPIFPNQLNLAANFPRLWSFEIYTDDDDFSVFGGENVQWSKFLGYQGTFPSVTKLRISVNVDNETIPPSWCQELGVMFPNTKDLDLDTLSDFPSVAPILWRNFKKVKYLKLYFYADLPENVYPTLDCGFSGLSLSQHEEMEQSPIEFSPELSENLSILELADLEEVHILLDILDESERELTQILSTVAVQTFKMMSQLKKIKVVIGDQYLDETTAQQILDSLEPLKDYGVKIVSKKLT